MDRRAWRLERVDETKPLGGFELRDVEVGLALKPKRASAQPAE
jgi:hypothetical protein